MEGAAWIAENWDLRDRGVLVEPNLPVERFDAVRSAV
jgi:hypothetical protein